MGQWVYICGKFNLVVYLKKISFKKRVIVINIRPEAEWSNHEQVENTIEIYIGGPNSCLWKKIGMTCD